MKALFLKQAHKFIKNSDKPLKQRIQTEIDKILEAPEIGKRLQGTKLKNIRSHKFNLQRVQYRIAYEVRNDLIIIYIASRENFYRDLENNV